MAAHFNHAGASIPPPAVVERIVAHLRLEAEIGGYEAAEAVAGERTAVSAALAGLIGAAPDEVVAVESATRGWELALWAFAHSEPLVAGDRIVVDPFAYASSWATLQRLTAAIDVDVVVASAHPDGSIDAGRLGEVVDDRTRMVLVTHVPTHVGTVSDAAAVGAVLAGRDVVYALDVSQSLGQLVLDVGAIGCHIAFAPGRKFLRAPRGTGLLYVSRPLADTLTPLVIDLTTAPTLEADHVQLAPGAARFDLFEHSAALRLGLGVAASHALELGGPEIERMVRERSAAVAERIAAAPGCRLVASGPVSGIVSFVHDHRTADDVRALLGAEGVRVWVNRPGGTPVAARDWGLGESVRVSPHYTTSDDELDALAAGLASLANN
jgi:cysteine desulfurase / selenocysteine lyase